MSASKQIGWLVAPNGAVVKYDASLVRLESIVIRTPIDLHARARVGLMYVNGVLKKYNWSCNCIVQSSTSLSLSLGKVCIDVSIRKPSRIAYVTSRPGWEYKREVAGKSPDITFDGKTQKGSEIVRPTALVQLASAFIEDPYVVQIIATSELGDSSTPTYVPVNKEMKDPAIEVAMNVLLTLRNLLGRDKFKIDMTESELQDQISNFTLPE